MNWFVIIAGSVCAFTTIGHFAMGSKEFLKPMLQAELGTVSADVQSLQKKMRMGHNPMSSLGRVENLTVSMCYN